MADNLGYTPGTGADIATDDVAGVHYQKNKLFSSEADSAEGIGDTDYGSFRALWVDPRQKRIEVQATPTISTSIYSAKHNIGGLLTLANAARVNGGSITIESVQISDKDQEMAAIDLILYNQSITTPTDRTTFDPTDAENLNCRGIISIMPGDYADFNDNCVAHRDCATSLLLVGTSLYIVMVVRSTPTYTSTSDISVTLTIKQD